MTVQLGTETPLVPLTESVFGDDGSWVLKGMLKTFSRGHSLDGHCIAVEERGAIGMVHYIHPTLFAGLSRHANDLLPVYVTLEEDDTVVVRRQVSGEVSFDLTMPLCSAPLIEMGLTCVDNIMELTRRVEQRNARFEGNHPCCQSPEHVVKSRIGEMDVREAVLIIDYNVPRAFRAECYDLLLKTQPDFVRNCALDGRRIPHQSPVPIYNL